MTFEEYIELKERVEMGEEFQIYYKDQDYWISQNRNGYYFTRTKDSYTQNFKESKELFEKAKIGSQFIKDIYHEIKW